MYIDNIIEGFYNVVHDSRVLLFVNYDIDGICAARILQYLFRCDTISYTLVPVSGIQDLRQAYEENCEEIKYVVLLNCGGTIDIVELLEPVEDVIFFLVDSHRPTDLCNVFSSSQVRIIGKPDPEENIPEFDDVFREDSEEEGDNSDNSGNESDPEESRAAKRMRLSEEAILKRRESRLWAEKRDRIVFDYTQFSYFGKASAVRMFELALSLSKDNVDLLWCAIIGVTEQYLLGKIEKQQYILDTGVLQGHVSKLSHNIEDETEAAATTTPVTAPRISFIKDLQLALYRHWTVEASLRHSMYSACKLKLWTLKGERKLHELLVDMGLPLVQSRQKFCAMDMVLRQEFHSMIEKLAEKYNLDQLVFTSFILQHGFRNKFCASDVVYSMLALLESSSRDRSSKDCFLEAMDALSRSKKSLLEDGIERAKLMLTSIFKMVQGALDMQMVVSAGPFLYFVIQEGGLNARHFSHPHTLVLLAQFILQAHVMVKKKAINLPLIASAPLDVEDGTCLVVGIPPVVEDSPKNFFGKAFEQAAEKTNARAQLDYFDSSVMKLKTEDRSKFFDALAALLS
ncbi:Cell division control protein 45-like protein [Frankliniella fusca]|uniref:Cell division control protein 45-like protein n=1 Tax=Frankliniella fusca TaxID=407009 RepID=A0AAE1LPX0_9NEOP|nr:Cell division control protein 45-like protein [Frankliniella fusca]